MSPVHGEAELSAERVRVCREGVTHRVSAYQPVCVQACEQKGWNRCAGLVHMLPCVPDIAVAAAVLHHCHVTARFSVISCRRQLCVGHCKSLKVRQVWGAGSRY
jgi:hypothetical protein